MKKLPTYEEVSDKLEYDPETGLFRWRVRTHYQQKKGWFPGYKGPSGYRFIKVNSYNCNAHRLAWCLHNGAWPSGCIDHINREKGDNRIINLRDVTQSDNMHNADATGCTRKAGKFQVQFAYRGSPAYIGLFETPEEAQIAYWTAKNLLGLNPNYHGRTLL